ncbi:OCIA domain-containing protein 2 isoform X2 [Rhinatrema bivittatum]|uniref:OCIA domain-containing protein 2 isoform X2 n=1 Tax=Rhinatrema bivittatum TaxID=194408 RepID=UPI0011275528|nr:OCIA domain-containing protein 2 isoform X2 [Rhinatrema bivittatum]
MVSPSVQTPAAQPEHKKPGLPYCPISNAHIDREDVAKIIKECKEESFWHRALPLSLGSMMVTQGLVYKGYLASNPRLGSLPKVALAGVLGFVLGKISYMGECQEKFHRIGIQPFGFGFGSGFGRHKSQCTHICEECKAKQKGSESESTEVPAS